MIRKILVPLDGSKLAEQAIEPAIEITQAWHGEIILMRVPIYIDSRIQSTPAYDFLVTNEDVQPSYDNTVEYLQTIREQKSRPNINIRTIIGEGDRAGAIVDKALIENVDLIVMSTHGRTGISRFVFGSVTAKVLRQAHCPVLVIRQPGEISHILITLDGSPLAEEAIAPGLTLARSFNSRVTLLRVQQAGGDPDQIDVMEGAEQYLQDIVAINRSFPNQIEWVIKTGPVAESILDYAENNKVDLIAMTTHGRTGLRRWVYGSVTEKVLYAVSRAMLIIRPADRV